MIEPLPTDCAWAIQALPHLSDFKTSCQDESPLPQWQRMLRSYYAMNEPDGALWRRSGALRLHPPIAPCLTITRATPDQTMRPTDSLSLEAEVVGRKLAEVRRVIAAPLDGPTRRLTSALLSTPPTLDDGSLLTLAVVGLPRRSELDYADFVPSIFETARFDPVER